MVNRVIFAVGILLCSMLFVGCTSPVNKYTPQRTDISEPPLNAVNEAYVGDYMLRQGSVIMHDAIILNEDVSIGVPGAIEIKSGWYLKDSEDGKRKGSFYRPVLDDSGGEIHSQYAPSHNLLYVLNNSSSRIGLMYNGSMQYVSKSGVDFKRTQKVMYRDDSFQQTLIYSGRVGDKVNVSYREFYANSARPSFNNEVEYDLGDSNVIRYKGARLEILDATNESIKYKVLSNFNQAKF